GGGGGRGGVRRTWWAGGGGVGGVFPRRLLPSGGRGFSRHPPPLSTLATRPRNICNCPACLRIWYSPRTSRKRGYGYAETMIPGRRLRSAAPTRCFTSRH